jgi:hypothetical protein
MEISGASWSSISSTSFHVEVREALVESVHLMNRRPGVRQAAEVWQGPLTLAEEGLVLEVA